MASTFLSTTLGTPTSSRIWTFSTWLKRSGLSSGQHIFSIDNGSQRDAFSFDSDDGLRLYFNGSATGYADLSTNRLLRDTSAFYHLVIAVDTTQATAANRVKLYINGTQYTWDETTVYGDQNYDTFNASGNTFRIGRDRTATAYFDGILAHTHFIDGTQYAASTFGETDSTSGIWKPKTAPSVTYGNNGFFLKFENSGNLDLDSSGNSRSFTTSGTLTQNVDTPSKNYNTLNPVIYSTTGVTLAHGNTSFNSGSGVQYGFAIPSFALNKGRWYFEAKIGHTCAGLFIGDTHQVVDAVRNSTRIGVGSQQYSWECNGNFQNNNSQTSYGSTAAANDIIGMFVDLEDNKLYIAVNGTIQNSGTGFSITDPNSTETGFYYVGGIADQCSATANVTAEMNYGGGKFGVTAISSAQADANGEGIFEYSPNQGGASNFDSAAKNFYALNTKNIKEFG